MSEATSAPVPLSTAVWGHGETTILLVHGVGSHSGTWWRIAPALAADGCTCVAVDLRGHGASPRADRYDAASYAGDLLPLRPPGGWDLVIGHSLGGLLTAAAAHQAEAAGGAFAGQLMLIDPVFTLAPADEETVLADLLAENADPPGLDAVLRENPRWAPEDGEAKLVGIRQASRTALERTMRQNSPWAHAALLTGLRTPTLVLGSDPAVGAMFEPAMAAAVTRANPLIEYRTVPGAGHLIQRDDPAAVLATARELVPSPRREPGRAATR